jgi:hypothetical protein
MAISNYDGSPATYNGDTGGNAGTYTVKNADGSTSIVYGPSAGALAGKVYSTTSADGSKTDYYYGQQSSVGTNTTNPDGTYTSTDVKSGTTSGTDASGNATGVTDANGNKLTPQQVNDLNNKLNGPLGNGGILGLGDNPVTGVIQAGGAAVAAGKTTLEGGTPDTGQGGVSTASQNLGQFDPNAALPDQFKITTPVISAPNIPNAPQVTAPAPVTPPSLDFNTGLTAPQISSVPTAGTIPVVSAPQLGPAPTISAGGVSGGSISAQNIDPSAAKATPVGDVSAGGVGRDAETQGLDFLRGIAEGTTETAADKLLQKGVDENVGAAYGLAASLQGRNPGQALRQGLTSARTAIAKSSADIAAQKAQEQQDAMKQYATLGTSIAGQDLQAAMSNQSKDLQLSVTQMQSRIEILKANQAAQLSAGEATLASQTSAQIATLQAQTQIATSQLQASTARDIANQTAQLDASKSNAANQVATQIAQLQAQVQVQTANLQAAVQTQNTQAQLDAQKQIAQYQGQLSLLQQQQDQLFQAAKDNAANQTQTNIANASNQTQTSIASAQLAEKAKADENTMDAQLKQLGLSALVAQLNAAIESAKTDQQRQAAEDQFWASIIGTGGKVTGGKVLSA